MLPDVQGAMFIRDGVGPDLIRAGEPRLRTNRSRDLHLHLQEAVTARARVRLLRKALRPLAS